MSDGYGRGTPTGVCALPGCPEPVSNVDHGLGRGYPEKHVCEASLEAIDNLGGHVDQLGNQERTASPAPSRKARADERPTRPKGTRT